MNGYDYCSSCGKVFDYLDLKPHKLKWYCKNCYKEILKTHGEESLVSQSKFYMLSSHDYCNECGKLFDYLELKPYNTKWYCMLCYDKKIQERLVRL